MSDRSGFTLIEAVVWITVLTILAVSFTPPLIAAIDRGRQEAGLAFLQQVQAGVTTFEADIGEYPTGLDQLLEPLVNGDEDICGDNYNGGERNQWDGPYFNRPLPAGGVVMPIGTVVADFPFVDTGTLGLVFVRVNDVDEGDALGLDAFVDDNDGSTAGSILWTAPDAEGLVVLYYQFQIPSC